MEDVSHDEMDEPSKNKDQAGVCSPLLNAFPDTLYEVPT